MRFVVLLILIFLNMLFKKRKRVGGGLWFDVKEFSFLTKKESEGN